MPPESKNILIVEDIRSISHALAAILKAEGYQVDIAGDGEEALAKIVKFRPHLMILDLLMPKMHGIEVLKRVRAMPEGDHIGVILSTTKDFTTEKRQAEELGVFGRLDKPATRTDLLAEVTRYFESDPHAALQPLRTSAPDSGPEFKPVLGTERGMIRMWGTRGSIPVSGRPYQRHGGNTTCMEFELGSGSEEVLIFDAGSGIREAGARLAAEGAKRPIHLFVTHTHWDHIQGFPFFAPLFFPGAKITIYGDKGFGKGLESVFRGQFARDYFPVQWDDFRAAVEFRYLNDEPVEIGGARITREFVNHPGATLGYKIEYRDRTTVFIPDNEFLQGYLGPPEKTDTYHDLMVTHLKVIAFLKDADVVIHEAQYTNEEYPHRVGWGHSSVSNACILFGKTRTRDWIVTHHDPSHDDEFLSRKLALTQQLLEELKCPTRVSHAYDGLTKWL